MPQEIEVWYLLPALRKELAKIFKEDFNLSQKQISEILGITESAVSQYIKSKRASELKFSEKELLEIKKTAREMLDTKNSYQQLYELSKKMLGNETLCKIHRKHDKTISHECRICME